MNNKLFFVLALCGALAACNKAEETNAPAKTTSPATQSTSVAPTESAPASPPPPPASAPATAASGLPQACSDYIARAEACFAKAAPDAAAMMKSSFDATVAEWKKSDDMSSLGDTCKQMNDMFADTAKMLGCE